MSGILNFSNEILEGILLLLAFLLAVSIHEFSHAYSAYLLGDSTAKDNGRMTINPMKHFDPFALIVFIFLKVGFAKGVPIDPRNFKNTKMGMVLTAAAGPASNILLSFLSLLFLKLIPMTYVYQYGGALYYLYIFLDCFVQTNLILAIFNLLPIPPLDGSKIFLSVLPDRIYYKILSYDRQMFTVILILAFFGFLNKFITTGVKNLYDILELIVKVIIP